MNKPEWMLTDKETLEFLTKFSDSRTDRSATYMYDLLNMFQAKVLRKLLEHLRDDQWYTKIIPQGKGQRMISKRTGINPEFIEALLKELPCP